MTSDERELKRLVTRHLPSHMVFVAARERVLNDLRATPPHLQKPRLADLPPSVSWLRSALPLAAAAALVIVAVGGAMVWPRGVRVYAAGNDGLQVTLADDSRVEMRAHAEMTVGRASDGIQIDLKTGDIIVTAAKQRDGHLYVRTKDMVIAVDGTVFLVNSSQDGSRVAVIEGEVRVQDGQVETKLRPGERMSSRQTPAAQVRPVMEEIAWSRQRDAYLALLQSAVADAPVAQQSSAPPARSQAVAARFEEASIRACAPGDSLLAGQGRGGGANGSTLRMTPGRYYAECVTVGWMIYSSYPPDVPDRPTARPSGAVANMPNSLDGAVRSRLRGGPSWIYEDKYTVDAVADVAASMVSMQHPMMWDLLERRLHVKVHRETEHVRAFELSVARGGLKLKPIADGETCVTDQPRTRLPDQRRNSEPSRCGISMKGGWVGGEGPNYRWEVSGSLRALITLLRSSQGPIMNGPSVLNETGIERDGDTFNFALEFAPDETTPGYLQRCAAERERFPRCAERPTAPPLATVLERELGLKFQPTTEPREFIMIDAVERPSPN